MNRIGEERVGLNMSRILIVEDEVAIADLEKDYLELSDFQVDICNSGAEHGSERGLQSCDTRPHAAGYGRF